ncbi:hypothetical protein CW368_13215 [Actinomycetales bacterium SN12]|nr:hypothetical protein CW368_13215 [Actinomycetales bacterium SN12]
MSDEPDATPSDDAPWGDAGLLDPFGADAFTQEIANISESDWDLDADEIWGGLAGGLDGGGDLPGPELFA